MVSLLALRLSGRVATDMTIKRLLALVAVLLVFIGAAFLPTSSAFYLVMFYAAFFGGMIVGLIWKDAERWN